MGMNINHNAAGAGPNPAYKPSVPVQGQQNSPWSGPPLLPAPTKDQPGTQQKPAGSLADSPVALGFTNTMDQKLLGADYQNLQARFNQAFDPKKTGLENIQSVSSAIGKPIRYIQVDQSGKSTTQEVGGKMSQQHKPGSQDIEDLKGQGFTAYAQQFQNTGENNVIDMTAYQQTGNPIQAKSILGHELFHLMQAKGNGGYEEFAGDSPVLSQGRDVIQKDLTEVAGQAHYDFDRLRAGMDKSLDKYSDVKVLESALSDAKLEYQAHSLDQQLSAGAAGENPEQARAAARTSQGSKVFYGAAVEELEERLRELQGNKTQP